MDTLRRMMVFLLLALMVGSAPLSQGLLVFCATSDGHRAVEVGHGPMGCSATSSVEPAGLQVLAESDCTDTPLSIVQQPKPRPERDAHEAFLAISLSICLIASADTPKLDCGVRWSASDADRMSFATSAMLRTVVLLI